MQTYGVTSIGRVPGPVNAECVLHIPDSDWIITSSLNDREQEHGHIYAVNVRDRSSFTVFPDALEYVHDDTYDADLPVPRAGTWSNHGMAIKAGADNVHSLAVVNHTPRGLAPREAVEMFEVRIRDQRPHLTHVGTVLQQEGKSATDLAFLPGDEQGFVINSLYDPREPDHVERMVRGEPMGQVFTWTPTHGWSEVPGGPFACPNGIEISPDGRHVFIGGWVTREVLKVARDGSEPVRVSHGNGVLLDNFTWTSHGTLLNAGHLTDPGTLMSQYGGQSASDVPWAVVEVDPETLEVVTLAGGHAPEGWGMATAAVQVGDEIWVGSARAKGLWLFKRS